MGMRERGSKSKPSVFERSRVKPVDQTLVVDEIPDMSVDGLKPDMIPVVRLEQMLRVGVFSENLRTELLLINTSAVAVITG